MSVRNRQYHKGNPKGQEDSLHFCESDRKILVTMQYRYLLKRQIDIGQKCAQKSIADKSMCKYVQYKNIEYNVCTNIYIGQKCA